MPAAKYNRPTAMVSTEEMYTAEIHWYEAHGIGKREYKLKLT